MDVNKNIQSNSKEYVKEKKTKDGDSSVSVAHRHGQFIEREKERAFMAGSTKGSPYEFNDAVRRMIGDPRPTTTTVLRGLRLSTSLSLHRLSSSSLHTPKHIAFGLAILIWSPCNCLTNISLMLSNNSFDCICIATKTIATKYVR